MRAPLYRKGLSLTATKTPAHSVSCLVRQGGEGGRERGREREREGGREGGRERESGRERENM